jgi:undecaprenyl pyrophosphate phosphatase UppP
MAPGDLFPFLVGFISSSITGYLCIKYLLRFLQVRTMAIFIAYRLILGIGLLIFSVAR